MRITHVALLKLVDIGFAHKHEPLSCVPQVSNQAHIHTRVRPAAGYVPCADSDSIFHHWKTKQWYNHTSWQENMSEKQNDVRRV